MSFVKSQIDQTKVSSANETFWIQLSCSSGFAESHLLDDDDQQNRRNDEILENEDGKNLFYPAQENHESV